MQLEYIIKTHTSEYLSVDTRPRVGDRVLIKSIDWYHQNCDSYGTIECTSTGGKKTIFLDDMSALCGSTCTITELIYESQCVRLYEDVVGFLYPLNSIECIVR